MSTRLCKQCGTVFSPGREDHFFCSAKCVAAYYRDHDDPEYIHTAKAHEFLHHCDQCGKSFFVNEYAERGGKRAPKYCSVNCKQSAYRARQKETKKQARRRQESEYSARQGNAEQERVNEEFRRSYERMRDNEDRKQRQQSQNSVFDMGGTSRQDALIVMGLSDPFTQAVLKARWLKMIKYWHPDVNSAPEATMMAQRINWAYDKLK